MKIFSHSLPATRFEFSKKNVFYRKYKGSRTFFQNHNSMNPVSIEDVDNIPVPETEEPEETVTKQEILDGDAKISIKEIFPFLISHVTQMFGKRTGVGTPLDMNFLYFHQLNSRKSMEAVTKYTFLHPLLESIQENQKAPTLLAIEPVSQCRSSQNVLVDKKAFLLYVLLPKTDDSYGNLLDLHKFFEKNIRGQTVGESQVPFAYILNGILQCNKQGFLHFNYEKDEDEAKIEWVFEYINKKLFVYKIDNRPPVEDLEVATLSHWLSNTYPYFERRLQSVLQIEITVEELESIEKDPEVIAISK